MRTSLVATLAALGALGVTAAGSLTANASPAVAPADIFYVVSAGASATNPDQLTVVVDSSSTIASLTAQFLANGTAYYHQALTLASTGADPADATQTQTSWTADIPAGASGLPLYGGYSVTLNGSFTDSAATYSQPNAAVFSFLATSAVTLKAANANLSYPNTAADLSGTVTLTNPDGTADTDYTGASVAILADGSDVESLTIGSDGTFSDATYAPSATVTMVAAVVGPAVEGSQSAPVTITATETTPTLKLKVNPVTENYGKTATVTGTLTYAAGSTSEPVPAQEIWIGTQKWDWGSPLATGTTGTDGSFSITLPAQDSGTTLYVGTTNQPTLIAVEAPLQVNVVNPTVIGGFKVSLNQYWALSVSGCLGFGSGNTVQRFYHTSGLTVQYAASAKGPWKNLFAINGNESDTPCGTGGIRFTGSHVAPGNYAYYRVVYAGTKGATSYAPTSSNAVLAWRYADRITGFKVSPTTVNAGGKLTVKGTLQYYFKTWHNYSGQTIVIILRPKGRSTWYWEVKVKTNSKGQFSAIFKDPVSATWAAEFDGNNSGGGHLSAGSPQVYVRLK